MSWDEKELIFDDDVERFNSFLPYLSLYNLFWCKTLGLQEIRGSQNLFQKCSMYITKNVHKINSQDLTSDDKFFAKFLLSILFRVNRELTTGTNSL